MDAALTLAFSMHKNPGIYALLLGSGISQSVGILTGWEITRHINEQIKAIGGEPDESFGYDELLKQLGKTPTERNTSLRKYFEPDEKEREQGIKIPSKAHRAIATLVRDGYIRVILTTNFDRLLEQALEEIGITPDVISSDDMLQGAIPIRHSKITIVKLHGDYRDIRTLNTAEELGQYSAEKMTLLDTIFSEYGLIVCGWSAKWDTALRDSIYRISPRWYSSYWVEPDELSDAAKEVIHHRSAEIIQSNADDFFKDLQGKVEALAKLDREHPLSVAVAIERVKKLLPYEQSQIELEDLLDKEAKKAYSNFAEINPDGIIRTQSDRETGYRLCLATYFARTEHVINMAVTVCWFGKEQQTRILADIISLWGMPKDSNDEEFEPKHRIPALLLVYACGIAAIHRENWTYLRATLLDPRIISYRQPTRLNVLERITKPRVLGSMNNSDFPPGADFFTELLREVLYPVFKHSIPGAEFEQLFDLFEVILTVVSISNGHGVISHNAMLKRYSLFGLWKPIESFWIAGARAGFEWGFLNEFFDGNRDKLVTALKNYQEQAVEVQRWLPKHEIPNYSGNYLDNFREK